MAKTSQTVELKALDIRRFHLELEGLSPLIMHRWADKARKEMLDKQMKRSSKGKEAKDPEADFENSKYVMPDGAPGFPAGAFKQAAIRGAKALGMVMTDARTSFFVHGVYSERDGRELVKLTGVLTPREDMVRVGMGTADIRYRAQVWPWSATVEISHNAGVISAEQIAQMLDTAGYGVGIGDWRPEKDGEFGRFKVKLLK